MTPYYEDNHCAIYHDDCATVLPQLSTVDLVFTSPPYNLAGNPWTESSCRSAKSMSRTVSKWNNGSAGGRGITYDEHDDAMPWPEYVAWQHFVLNSLWDVLSPDGAIFYNHKPRVIDKRLWTPLELNPGLPLRQIVIWARTGGLNYNATAFVPTHEWIMILAKQDWRLKSKAVSGIGDVWRVPQEANTDHPAPFPASLPARAIEATRPGLVLDPFMGIGSTLRAAKDAGVKGIGIEKSERYCEIAAKRLGQEVLF